MKMVCLYQCTTNNYFISYEPTYTLRRFNSILYEYIILYDMNLFTRLDISISILYEYCKDQKIFSLGPLRVMGCAFQTWPKSIKFVRGG